MKEHSLAIYETTAENGRMLRMTAGNCAQLKVKTHCENMRKKIVSILNFFITLNFYDQCGFLTFLEVSP